MESVLDVYKRPYDPDRPVVCMDETSKQLTSSVKLDIPMALGNDKKVDYEYRRHGVANVFMANEPLAGKRMARVTDHRKKPDWAQFVRMIAFEMCPDAEKITLVMDNLNTHDPSSLYQTFRPEEAKRIWDRFEFVYTPKHGSWLNMAEIELHVLNGQCLDRHIPDRETLEQEVEAWCRHRNNGQNKIDWRFTTKDARVKLKRLYPSINN